MSKGRKRTAGKAKQHLYNAGDEVFYDGKLFHVVDSPEPGLEDLIYILDAEFPNGDAEHVDAKDLSKAEEKITVIDEDEPFVPSRPKKKLSVEPPKLIKLPLLVVNICGGLTQKNHAEALDKSGGNIYEVFPHVMDSLSVALGDGDLVAGTSSSGKAVTSAFFVI